MEKFKQGTRVEFNIQNLKGKGTIVGVAMDSLPVIGNAYIIEPDEKLPNEYNYTHFAVWESQFKVI